MVNKPKAKELRKLEIKGKIVAEKDNEIKITSKKVMTIFQTSVKPNSTKGAYITIQQKFNHHKAFVIIMQEKVK